MMYQCSNCNRMIEFGRMAILSWKDSEGIRHGLAYCGKKDCKQKLEADKSMLFRSITQHFTIKKPASKVSPGGLAKPGRPSEI